MHPMTINRELFVYFISYLFLCISSRRMNKDNIIPQLCSSEFRNEPCTNDSCCYLHLPTRQISFNELLDFKDLFYVKEQAESVSAVKVNLTEREKNALTLPEPVLCDVCAMPINSNNDYYFPCCDVFMCEKCVKTWPYQNCCSSCGIEYQELLIAPFEKSQDVEKRNEPILKHEIVKFN